MNAIQQRHAGMRAGGVVAAAVIASGLFASHAAAQCAGKKDAIGVARTITIDTAGGKSFGAQYGDAGLLKDGEVVLTFDDGPARRYTRKVLDALKAECTKATFFMVGRMAVSDPAMVREVEADGHTIATHTWSHLNLGRRNARKAGGEIELGVSTIQKAAAKQISPFFRFPYLSDSKSMLAYINQRNLGVFSIDIDSLDYRTRAPEKVFGRVMRLLRERRKGIILFHDIQRSTAGAMPRLLATMRREGFKVVHIVAKAPVTTLPDYDQTAAELVAKRRTQVAAASIEGGAYERAGPSRPAIKPAEPPAHKTRMVLNSGKTGPILSVRQPAPSEPKRREAPATVDWRKAVLGN